MKIKLVRYARHYTKKKWVIFHSTYLKLDLPLSAIQEIEKKSGSYYTKRTSNKLVYFKHFEKYDLKGVYSYVG